MLGHLSAAGIAHAQHRVLVDEATVIECVDVCLRFVDEVELLG